MNVSWARLRTGLTALGAIFCVAIRGYRPAG